MNKVKFNELWNNYPDSNPCNPKFKNQCAIKVGVALSKSGADTTKLVSKKRHCWFHGEENGHVLSAEELAKGLSGSSLPGLEKAIEIAGKNFKSKIAGRKGIIFFENYWLRSEGRPSYPTGDHIDLWNGQRLTDWSSWIRIQLGVVIPDVWSDLEKAPRVLFWNIPQ